MKRRTFVLSGMALGLGAVNLAIFVARSKREDQLSSSPPPRRPLRLPSVAPASPSSRDEDICSIAFSLLGSHLVSGSAFDELSIWDPAKGYRVSTWSGPPRGGFAGIGFCSDNSWLATISPFRGVKFWTPGKTIGTGKTTFKEITYNEFTSHPTCVAFRPLSSDSVTDSSSLAAVALGDNSIRILEHDPTKRVLPAEVLSLRTNDPRAVKVPRIFRQSAVLRGHEEQINALSFSHDGKVLASASDDHTIRIWNTGPWQQVAMLRGHTGAVNSVSFSRNGSRLASASTDQTIMIWDRNTMARSGVLSGHADSALNAVFCGRSDWLASTSVDRKILFWPLESGFGRSYRLADNPGNYAAIDVSADGQYFASSWEKVVRFWKISAILAEAKRELKMA